MEPTIKQRIIKSGKRVGMIMAFKFEDDVKIGFCLCSKSDKYDHELAHKICYARATSIKEMISVPQSIIPDLDRFTDRCNRYFKDLQ